MKLFALSCIYIILCCQILAANEIDTPIDSTVEFSLSFGDNQSKLELQLGQFEVTRPNKTLASANLNRTRSACECVWQHAYTEPQLNALEDSYNAMVCTKRIIKNDEDYLPLCSDDSYVATINNCFEIYNVPQTNSQTSSIESPHGLALKRAKLCANINHSNIDSKIVDPSINEIIIFEEY